MICHECGFINRQGVIYCEQCGARLQIPAQTTLIRQAVNAQVVVCGLCGAKNNPGAVYCNYCGGALSVAAQMTPSQVRAKTPSEHRPNTFRRILLRVAIIVVVILIFLMILGMINPSQAAAPEYSLDAAPMIILQGDISSSGTMRADPGNFGVLASDPLGIQRIELYADGDLVAAKNFEGEQAVFTPPIEDLPPGVDEVFVRVTNTAGQTAQTAIFPVDLADEGNANGVKAGGLIVEPDALNLPLPVNLEARVSDDRESIKVTWQPEGNYDNGSKVYIRFPDAAGLILVATLPAGEHMIDLPVDKQGSYEIFVSMLDAGGREGQLVSTMAYIPLTGYLEVSSSTTEGRVTAAYLQVTPNSGGLTGFYAYLRLGGPDSLFQRFPAQQGEFLPGDVAHLTFSPVDWPVSQPLPVEGEVWGYTGSGAVLLSRINTTLQPEDIAQARIEYRDTGIEALISLEIEGDGENETGDFGGPVSERAEVLPPPSNLHIALQISDCQEVASEPGTFFNRTRKLCMDTLNHQSHNFLIWDWPYEGAAAEYSEADISGFEIRLYQIDANGDVVGQNMASIPYAEARGTIRLSGVVACGVEQDWYLRAVGPGAASEWVYAGRDPGVACESAAQTGFEWKGCLGIDPEIAAKNIELIGPVAPPWDADYHRDQFKANFGKEIAFFEPACNTHNQCYEQKKNKVKCDNQFLVDMGMICIKTGQVTLDVAVDDCKTKAMLLYTFYNSILGREFYPGKINPFDCWQSYNKVDCALAASPELGQEIYDLGEAAVKSTVNNIEKGYHETVDAIETGAGKVKDAGGWLGKKTGLW